MMSEGLYRLVYVSRSFGLDGPGRMEAAVADILAQSRANNARAGITGALLFSAGLFAQTLEGPMNEVMDTFERIQCDPRHRDTVILHAGRVRERDFGEWSMAYAGRVEDDRLRFAMPEPGTAHTTEAAGAILTAMRNVVLRAEAA